MLKVFLTVLKRPLPTEVKKSATMKSLQLLTWLLTFGVFVGASTDAPTPEPAPESLNAGQYKNYLINLECAEIRNFHQGVKIQGVSGPLYAPSPSPQPQQQATPLLQFPIPLLPVLPNPPSPATRPSPPEQVTTSERTTLAPSNSSQKDSNPYSEYDEDIITRSKREDLDQTTSLPLDNFTFAGDMYNFSGDVNNFTLAGDMYNFSGDVNNFTLGGDTTTNYTVECTAPLTQDWSNYNWYQVLLDNGGPPASYLRKGLTSNLTKVFNPCERPVYPVQPLEERTTFGFTHTRFEKIHRTEQVEVIMAGTPHEFVDVKGELVWAPPNSTRRYFHMTYRKDDTGLYFTLDKQKKCVFYEYDVRVECNWTPSICDCFNGKEYCQEVPRPVPAAGVPAGLQAALVGGG